jgi:hypothetical protein
MEKVNLEKEYFREFMIEKKVRRIRKIWVGKVAERSVAVQAAIGVMVGEGFRGEGIGA